MPFKDPEARKLYQQKYHAEHREEHNTRKHARRQTEEYKERTKQYLLDNKDKFDAKNKERFTCGCGGCYTRHDKTIHEQAKMHIEWIREQIQTEKSQ